MQLLLWMQNSVLPVNAISIMSGLSADFGEVLSAASIPYPLLLSAARSCLESLPALADAAVRIKAKHSLACARMACLRPADITRSYGDKQSCLSDEELHLFNAVVDEAKRASLCPQTIISMQLTLAVMISNAMPPEPPPDRIEMAQALLRY